MPVPQSLAVRQPKLLERVGHVKFHGVDADPAPFGDLAAGHAVLHGMHHPPPCGGRCDLPSPLCPLNWAIGVPIGGEPSAKAERLLSLQSSDPVSAVVFRGPKMLC